MQLSVTSEANSCLMCGVAEMVNMGSLEFKEAFFFN